MTLKQFTTTTKSKNEYGKDRRQEKVSVKGTPKRKPHFRRQWVGELQALNESMKADKLPKEIRKQILDDAKKNYANKKSE